MSEPNLGTMELMTTIPRSEAKAQFDFWTKQLNLKHTFSFEEVYDMMMERRIAREQQIEFRSFITAVEKKLEQIPGTQHGNCHPLTHSFADGMYIRQLTVPAQTLTVTKIHAKDNPFFLLKGTMTMLTEKGEVKITAPYWGITKAGTKRIIWHHDEVLFCTVHRCDSINIDGAEEEITAKNFEEVDNRIEQKRIADFLKLMKEK